MEIQRIVSLVVDPLDCWHYCVHGPCLLFLNLSPPGLSLGTRRFTGAILFRAEYVVVVFVRRDMCSVNVHQALCP
jgi:hypothetical protein